MKIDLKNIKVWTVIYDIVEKDRWIIISNNQYWVIRMCDELKDECFFLNDDKLLTNYSTEPVLTKTNLSPIEKQAITIVKSLKDKWFNVLPLLDNENN